MAARSRLLQEILNKEDDLIGGHYRGDSPGYLLVMVQAVMRAYGDLSKKVDDRVNCLGRDEASFDVLAEMSALGNEASAVKLGYAMAGRSVALVVRGLVRAVEREDAIVRGGDCALALRRLRRAVRVDLETAVERFIAATHGDLRGRSWSLLDLAATVPVIAVFSEKNSPILPDCYVERLLPPLDGLLKPSCVNPDQVPGWDEDLPAVDGDKEPA